MVKSPALLSKAASFALQQRPTLKRLINLVSSFEFHELRQAVIYLKEFAMGLRIADRLIALLDRHPQLDMSNCKHRQAVVSIWRLKLAFLDYADLWDEYLDTVGLLRERPELATTIQKHLVTQATYEQYKSFFSQPGLPRANKGYFEACLSEIEQCPERIHEPGGQWSVLIPAKTEHMLDDWDLKERLRIVQRKATLRDAGKRVDYLRHKQVWQLSDEEYETRREWLGLWSAFCQRWRQ